MDIVSDSSTILRRVCTTANVVVVGIHALPLCVSVLVRVSPCRIGELTPALVGKKVLVRARIHASRETGKVLFVTLRQAIDTAQALVLKADNGELFKWVASLPKESFVDITGTVTAAEKPVLSVSNGAVELVIESAFMVSKASPVLPFQLEDAARPDHVIAAREAEIKAAEAEGKAAPAPFPIVTSVSAAFVAAYTPCIWH